ncbi:MAG: hypothetical protein F4039_00645 [Gammaproteobacteria bacterium]|nr:hypothetical protein [Gammaproteobacteria bacterium]MXX95977.1 hypothetical protein [Gammaproteobacteria bacterium]MYF52640.1 hypothetical protein [Gammaproteobacteria bacterium]MYK42588.1 hypothetical protein [Gammaproteobacteria bacterium]
MTNYIYQGFLLQSSCRIELSKPIIHHYGRLTDGASFLIRETRQTPCFYISEDQYRNRRIRKFNKVRTSEQAIDGASLLRLECSTPNDIPSARDTLHLEGIATYEGDITLPQTHLIDNNICGGVEINASNVSRNASVDYVFENPELSPADIDIQLRVLAMEVEIFRLDPLGLQICLQGDSTDLVLVIDPVESVSKSRDLVFADLRTGLRALDKLVAQIDPDVLMVWNLRDSDLVKLLEHCRCRRQEIRWGRTTKSTFVRRSNSSGDTLRVLVPGRLFVDVKQWIQRFFPELTTRIRSNFRSALSSDKPTTTTTLDQLKARVQLLFQLIQQLNIPQFAVLRTQMTGAILDPSINQPDSLDAIYLRRLRPRGIRARSTLNVQHDYRPKQPITKIFRREAGLSQNVSVCRFKDLWPNLIRMFNIDWLTLTKEDCNEAIHTNNQITFTRQRGILPQIFEEIQHDRSVFSSTEEEILNRTTTLIKNSLMEAIANPRNRFYDRQIVNAIWSLGRHFLLYAIQWFEAFGCRVIFNDGKQIYICVGNDEPNRARKVIEILTTQFNQELNSYVRKTWYIANTLKINAEYFYQRVFLVNYTTKRNRTRTNLAALHHPSEQISLHGFDFDRKITFPFLSQFQKNLYQRVLYKDCIHSYVYELIDNIKRGHFDHRLGFNDRRKFNRLYNQMASKDERLADRLVRIRENRSRFINQLVKPMLIPVYQAIGERTSTIEILCNR